MEITLDLSEVNAFALRAEGAQAIVDREIEGMLTAAAITVQSRATRLVPVDTGTLKNSLAYEVTARQATVGSQIEYAPYVEYGTGLYGPLRREITPRNASVLAWQGRDRVWRFARSVRGRRATPFLGPAFQQSLDDIQRLAREAAVAIARQVVG